MTKDTIVIDSFDIPKNARFGANKAIADELAKLKISAKAVFSITTFKNVGYTWYTVWYKRCKRCKEACNHHG